jgi:hypothetical protein
LAALLFSRLLTWIYYLAFAAICIWLIWRFHKEILQAIHELLAQLRGLWESLFGERDRKPSIPDQPRAGILAASAAPFSSFANPFAAGTAEKVAVGELVTYTFRALEAWAREQGKARPAEQTPLEFAQMLVRASPAVGEQAQDVCDFYCRLAYGNGQLPRRARETLQRLWQEMESQQRA